jgi:hypothetical protein
MQQSNAHDQGDRRRRKDVTCWNYARKVFNDTGHVVYDNMAKKAVSIVRGVRLAFLPHTW